MYYVGIYNSNWEFEDGIALLTIRILIYHIGIYIFGKITRTGRGNNIVWSVFNDP